MSAVKTVLVAALVVVVGVCGLAGFGYWYYVKRDVPTRYADAIERFKYQSIGTEVGQMPFYIWKVLPRVCSDQIPAEGYASFGFTYEPGHDRPIGVTQRTIGVPRAGINCATCHTGTMRKTAQDKRVVVLGSPSHQLNLQKYARFLIACATGPNYTPDRVMAEIEKDQPLGPIDSIVYRYLVIPGTRNEILKLRTRLAWSDVRPDFGPGRVDSFNPVKADFGVDMAHDNTIGTTDFPSVWNQAARKGFFLHWDGSNDSTTERNIAATIASGATPDKVDHFELSWTADFLKTLPPPKYPFPIDGELAAQGEPIFNANCGRCHGPNSPQVGRTTPIAEIGTDRHRYDVFSQAMADTFNSIGVGYTWKFKGYRKSPGYQNMLLDGIWARGPYLHNGSVPNLHDLLEVPELRAKVFYRGYDVYDPDNVGYVSSGPEAERYFKYDTTLPGNSNAGHLYGTTLKFEDKRALIEYLKGL